MLIVEATHRIGGRIQKTNFAGLSVEIGAGWVEGVGGRRLNPIWDMVKRLKLKTFRSNYDNISYNAYKQKWVFTLHFVIIYLFPVVFYFIRFCIHFLISYSTIQIWLKSLKSLILFSPTLNSEIKV